MEGPRISAREQGWKARGDLDRTLLRGEVRGRRGMTGGTDLPGRGGTGDARAVCARRAWGEAGRWVWGRGSGWCWAERE